MLRLSGTGAEPDSNTDKCPVPGIPAIDATALARAVSLFGGGVERTGGGICRTGACACQFGHALADAMLAARER